MSNFSSVLGIFESSNFNFAKRLRFSANYCLKHLLSLLLLLSMYSAAVTACVTAGTAVTAVTAAS